MERKLYNLGSMKAEYIFDEKAGHVSMVLLPSGMEDCFDKRRKILRHRDSVCPAWEAGNLCHLALRHHPQGNGAGNTLKYGYSTEALKYKNQTVEENEERICIRTVLEAEEGYEIRHEVTHYHGEKGVEIETGFVNHTGREVTLELLTSFSLDNLSPFQKDDAPYKMKLHRFCGGWSLEGKHVCDTAERLSLEESWIRAFPESERYGCLGSHPVKRWFPFACVEDAEHHVFWAAQLACNSSWQMEFSRDGDCYSLSGGLSDSEFGGWWKNIADGEEFTAPKAYVSVSDEDLWDVCQNITEMFNRQADRQPESEQSLPLIFNEWCTTWGNPTEKMITEIGEKLEDMPFSYIVADAGWSRQPEGETDPQAGNGDWIVDERKFPNGLQVLSEELRKKSLGLGVWMEFEVTTKGAKVHGKEFDGLHLKRDGELIQTGKIRRFWDFRKEETVSYLKEKVIDFLRENKISYLKVDYNGSIGAGCDGAESPGEGLRAQMQAVLHFFEEIRKELPELVIENCASGGHRLEPSMMGVTAMSSFSDAHECQEIPYIAASLHALILPRQSQIWAVISPELSLKEVYYRLTSAMLGRFCLSGSIQDLNGQQWKAVKEAAEFYEKAKHIIKYGRSRVIRNCSDNQHHLKGEQALLREGREEELLLVYHSFDGEHKNIEGSLPVGEWEIKDQFGNISGMELENNQFKIIPQDSWESFAVLLRKKD